MPKYPNLYLLDPPKAPYVRIDDKVITMTFTNNPPKGFIQKDIYPHFTAEQLYKQRDLPIYFTPKPFTESTNYIPATELQYVSPGAARTVLQLNTRDALPLYFMKHLEER